MRSRLLAAGVALSVFPAVARAQQADPPASTAPRQAVSDEEMAEDAAELGDAIVVQASRKPRGSVIGDIPPDQQLGPADIRGYGVSSIDDLLTELGPQTQSASGGRPVVLLNGRRIANFRELRDLPTEAILRVDILPEEVALKYGYSADQRVVNIVLRPHFRSTSVELTNRVPTAGGNARPEVELGLVTINPKGRFSLNLEYEQRSRLLESERDIVPETRDDVYDLLGNITAGPGSTTGEIDPALSAAAGTPVTIAGVPASAASGAPSLGDFAANANQANVSDLGRYRTLMPETRQFQANAVLARSLGDDIQATINGSLEYNDSRALQGLSSVSLALPAGNPFSPFGEDVTLNRYVEGAPLEQTNRSITSHAGVTLNGSIDTNWRWTLTGKYDRVDSKSFTDLGVDASGLEAALAAGDPGVNPFGPLSPPLIAPIAGNHASSTSTTGGADALIHGNLATLPAGDVSTSLRIGAETNDFSSRSFRGGMTREGDISRDIVNGRLNVDLPITSKRRDFLAFAGDLSANVNIAVNRLSDFGTLTSTGYGVHWGPIDALRVQVSFDETEQAPSANQLGDPTIATPNSRIFDYVRGETVDITRITGGNPGLDAQKRHSFKAGFNLRPFGETDFNLRADYINRRTDNDISNFPAATAAIEAAFPERFVRDGAGQLISVDTRPINFARREDKRIRWGFNLSLPVKSKLQKEMEAYRNGTGPNPFEGMRRRSRPEGESAKGGDSAQGSRGERVRVGPDGEVHEGGRGEHGGRSEGRRGSDRRGPGGFGGFRGGGRGGGRIQLSVYHTWHLESRVNIRDGLPVLDLLNGDTSGSSGGQSRHEIEARAGYTNNGLGFRLSADWQSATRVNAGTAGAPEQLHFGSLATVDLRLFADLGQQLKFARDHRWARGMRISLSVDNLFNQRQRVTDAAGGTPISYQPDYLDPMGRTIRLSIRKLFS
ncbi:MAG TPA: TonB-dependent receptor [Sphingomonas sp.]|nr:TonB-dependent receptor [Sphingomonas sp.]